MCLQGALLGSSSHKHRRMLDLEHLFKRICVYVCTCACAHTCTHMPGFHCRFLSTLTWGLEISQEVAFHACLCIPAPVFLGNLPSKYLAGLGLLSFQDPMRLSLCGLSKSGQLVISQHSMGFSNIL